MIKLTTINMLGKPNILDLKKVFDKALRNMAIVRGDLLRIVWKVIKIALII